MERAKEWIRSLLTGKKDKSDDERQPPMTMFKSRSGPLTLPPSPPKEKKGWRLRRSMGARKELQSSVSSTANTGQIYLGAEADVAVASAATSTVPNAVASVGSVAAVAINVWSNAEEAAAVRIQAAFRAHLAMRALQALKALVKLQAVVRGYFVRKQLTAELHWMEALVAVQARARARRALLAEDAQFVSQKQSIHRRSPPPEGLRSYQAYRSEMDLHMDKDLVDLKHVQVKSRCSYSIGDGQEADRKASLYNGSTHFPSTVDQQQQQLSPGLSALADKSPMSCSEEFSFSAEQISLQCFSAHPVPDSRRNHCINFQQHDGYSISSEHPFHPNYMANTESSRAKVRSHSAPKQRPSESETQLSTKRRPSIEGRGIPKGVGMRRSSSQAGSWLTRYRYPWSLKVDRSNLSLKGSECGSTSAMLTNADL